MDEDKILKELQELKDLLKKVAMPRLPTLPQAEEPPLMRGAWDPTDPCRGCSNHPNNGGSGVCHCTIPYFHRKRTITW